MKILIADDEPTMRELLTVALRGHDLIKARDGAEAVALAERHQPDLVLMDVMMPEMDGFEALEHLKTGTFTAHIPVVLMSAGHTRAEHIERGRALGAVDYLAKPFNIFALGEKLEGWVRKEAGRAETQEPQELRQEALKVVGALTTRAVERILDAMDSIKSGPER